MKILGSRKFLVALCGLLAAVGAAILHPSPEIIVEAVGAFVVVLAVYLHAAGRVVAALAPFTAYADSITLPPVSAKFQERGFLAVGAAVVGAVSAAWASPSRETIASLLGVLSLAVSFYVWWQGRQDALTVQVAGVVAVREAETRAMLGTPRVE